MIILSVRRIILKTINVILCGGSGTRLWPLSRKKFPKQFVSLTENGSLFQSTLVRNSSLCSDFCIVTSNEHYSITQTQLKNIVEDKPISYILEPVGRNTAPAIALACFGYNSDDLILVTPSDHLIGDHSAYAKCIETAKKEALNNKLVTFGIKPQYAETGYGYIEVDPNGICNETNICKVLSFREKPDKDTAEKYVSKGCYYWNSGIFLFKAGVFLNELKKYSPDIYETSLSAFESSSSIIGETGSIIYKIKQNMMVKIPENSIDYSVMEKSTEVSLVNSEMCWNDLGSFDSLYDVMAKDENGNVINDSKSVVSIDSNNNLVMSAGRKIAVIGINDTAIIDTSDAVCIIKRGSSQMVKDVVGELQKENNPEKNLTIIHTTVHRPWGSYTVLEENENYKIKSIVVKPGNRLSLQKHLHRNEHWVIVKGTANVKIGNEEKIVSENELVYINAGEIHRLSNEGKIDLIVIETQVGEYLGEDDITRIEDDYQRYV